MKKILLAIALIIPIIIIIEGCTTENNPVIVSTSYKIGGAVDTLYKDGEDYVTQLTMYVADQEGRAINIAASQLETYLEYNGQIVKLKNNNSPLSLKTVQGKIRLKSFSQTGKNIATALTMDYSGSMGSQLANMQTAVSFFTDQFQTSDMAEIIKFDDNVSVSQSFTNDKTLLKAIINQSYGGGGTALNKAIYYGLSDATKIDRTAYSRAVIAFTDGGENASGSPYSDDSYIINYSNNMNIPVFTIGLEGTGFNPSSLNNIANSTKGFYYQAPTSKDLIDIYNKISGVIRNSYELKANFKLSELPKQSSPATFRVLVISADGKEQARFEKSVTINP